MKILHNFFALTLLSQLFLMEIKSSCIDCHQIQGRINFNEVLFDKQSKNQVKDINQLRVELNEGQFYGYVNQQGNFSIHMVPPGQYVLKVKSKFFHFDQYFIDISKSSNQIKAYFYDSYGKVKVSTKYPLAIQQRQKIQYFEPVVPFSILGFLKSGYVIMILVFIGLMFLMKFMPNVEELQDKARQAEEMQKFQQQ